MIVMNKEKYFTQEILQLSTLIFTLRKADFKVIRSGVQIPNDTAKDDTEIAAALAGVQPDDDFHTPTHTHKNTRKERIQYALACKN